MNTPIDLMQASARQATWLSQKEDAAQVLFAAAGGGIGLPQVAASGKNYLIGDLEILEEHSVALMLRFFTKDSQKPRLFIRFGLLPQVKTRVCIDLSWTDNRTIFTHRTPGLLKLVIHGLRTDLKDVTRVELGIEKTFHDVKIELSNLHLSDEKESDYPLPDRKLVDEFGQWKPRDWPGKIKSFSELETAMKQLDGPAAYPFADWNRWGGDQSRKLQEGTGFFTTRKTDDGRWHLVDPDGCDYFSLGPCGTRPGDMGRVDGMEKLCDWLPDPDDPEYKQFFDIGTRQRTAYMPPELFKLFSFTQANLYRVYGSKWHEKWQAMSHHLLMQNGINSQGNFSALAVNGGESKLPYVRQISNFPRTETLIFRDFPDVLSPEYAQNATQYAQAIAGWKNDPWLIGYFLRNEPEFNFVPQLILADEVLRHPTDTFCRRGLIDFLCQRYESIAALNQTWQTDFSSFDDLKKPISDCSKVYPGSKSDLEAFSASLIREYIRVPAEACRKEDPNHLNLGLRWSKADNPLMMVGWEYFDVFSVNCYSFNPKQDMDFIKDAGVDLPIIIGEFHCGALDRGLQATGLKGVENQTERGVMWRYFVENCAAHPYGVGAHWFQYNDQFCLGRFDGENYQIGMVDVCMQPHPELVAAAKETSEILYAVRNGEAKPYDRAPRSIPMIGY